MYDFTEQLQKGEGYEAVLDRHYSKTYKIQHVSMSAQKSGIDRTWTDENGLRFSIEYKADDRAATSGNVFIELVSVDNTQKAGWAKTSCAQVLVYYIPPKNKAYLIPMLVLKNLTIEWEKKYSRKIIPNNGYNTEGVIVPIDEFGQYCFGIDNIGGGDG